MEMVLARGPGTRGQLFHHERQEAQKAAMCGKINAV